MANVELTTKKSTRIVEVEEIVVEKVVSMTISLEEANMLTTLLGRTGGEELQELYDGLSNILDEEDISCSGYWAVNQYGNLTFKSNGE